MLSDVGDSSFAEPANRPTYSLSSGTWPDHNSRHNRHTCGLEGGALPTRSIKT